jgi:hypothetical protein
MVFGSAPLRKSINRFARLADAPRPATAITVAGAYPDKHNFKKPKACPW